MRTTNGKSVKWSKIMTTHIHMDGELPDVEVDWSPEASEIKLKQNNDLMSLTPEGARSLAFVLMGMTSALKKSES